MNKIILNIDSRYRNQLHFPNPNNYILSMDNHISNLDMNYIKLHYVKIYNEYITIDKKYDNNYFIIKGIFMGPPPGPNVYNLPLEETRIEIPENKYTKSQVVKIINIELNKHKFNEYASDNTIIKGILFNQVSEKSNYNHNDTISIINLSKHYDCSIYFDNKNYCSSLGNLLGFNKLEYLIKLDTQIYSNPLNIDNYIFIKINNYNNIFLPNKPEISAFAKINISQFNNSEYIFTYNTNTEYIYQQQYTDKITELHIQILDYKGNLLNFDSDYNLTLELGIINQNVLENNSLVTFNELEQKLQKIQIVDEGVDKSCISYKINDDKSKALPLINSFGIDDDKSKASSLINSFGIDNLNHTFINDNTETINNDTYDILIDNTSQNVIHDNNYIPQEMNLSSKQEYNSNKKKKKEKKLFSFDY